MKGEFIIPSNTGTANALRRSLLNDIEFWAVNKLIITKNTTCQTDEFIAHRFGLVPFKKAGNGEQMNIRVEDRTLLASDVVGVAFQPVHDLEIMDLIPGQAFEAVLEFTQATGKAHARFKCCAAVGMKPFKKGFHRITFETIDERPPYDAVVEALHALKMRVDDALLQLADA
jgi:hypothetical protein